MEEKVSKKQLQHRSSVLKYDAETARKYYLKLNQKTDKELIEKLDSVDNVQGYIKVLIAADIAKDKEDAVRDWGMVAESSAEYGGGKK